MVSCLMCAGEAAARGPLTEDEIERLKQQLLAFVADEALDSSLNLGGDMMMIRAGEGPTSGVIGVVSPP
jgi:kinesin family protein 6/9